MADKKEKKGQSVTAIKLEKNQHLFFLLLE